MIKTNKFNEVFFLVKKKINWPLPGQNFCIFNPLDISTPSMLSY